MDLSLYEETTVVIEVHVACLEARARASTYVYEGCGTCIYLSYSLFHCACIYHVSVLASFPGLPRKRNATRMLFLLHVTLRLWGWE